MRWLLLIWFNLLLAISFGRVEFISLYYLPPDIQPTSSSSLELNKLKILLEKEEVQIIEINAYTELEEDERRCEVLARRRILYLLDYLDVKGEPITKNAYGKRRIDINFEPLSWERVDIYYNVEDFDATVTAKSDDTTAQKETKIDVESAKKIPTRDLIEEDTPIIIPIKFKGGSTEIKQESYKYLQHLTRMLETHTDLSAHIRGHVCCKNRKLKSKKRAKKVYTYLVKAGIDKSRLSYAGYSNTQPIAWPEVTEKDRATNRRVDIIFTKTKNL